MADKLVIVESPAKARTISKILGSDYSIQSSMGHVRDLPEKSLGVDVNNQFKPTYRINKGRASKGNKRIADPQRPLLKWTDGNCS